MSIETPKPRTNIGDTLIAGGAEFTQQVALEQERINRLRAEDGLNQLHEAEQELTLGEQGYAHVRGGNAVNRDTDLVKDYRERLTQRQKAIAGALPEGARALFEQRANPLVRSFGGKVLAHRGKEALAYEDQVLEGGLRAAVTAAGNSPTNEAAIDTYLSRFEFIARERGRNRGLPDEVVEQQVSAARDAVWTARLTAWRVADPVGAYAAFQSNADQMSAGVRAQMKDMLAGHALPTIAAQEAARNAPIVNRLAPAPGTPLPGPIQVSPAVEKFAGVIDTNAQQFGVDAGVMRRQLQAESGGNPAARNDGDVRVTGHPSIGIAQFQPATAKRYGIDPTDPVQSIRGQAAYMADLLKMFDGDYTKALAGYNWGEGNVQKAVAKHGDAWLAHAPATTQAYVRKIVAPERRTQSGSEPGGDRGAPVEAGSTPAIAANRAVDYASMSPAQLLNLKTGNPVIDAMPADDKLRTMGLIHSEALRQRQEKQALLGTREQDARASFYVNGTAKNAPTTAELVDAYGPIDGMRRARSLDEARATGQTIQQMSTLPTAQIQRLIEQKPVEGEGFADRQKAYEITAAAAGRILTARQADPIGYALATKSYGIQPLKPESLQEPAALATELAARRGAAAQIARDYGTAPALLTKPEAAAISSVLKSSPVPAQKQLLGALFQGAGDLPTYRALLQNLSPDAPTVALAGLYQVRQNKSTGPADSGPQRDVADLILRGHAILNPPKKEDGSDHIGGKSLVKMPKDDDLRLAFNGYVGDAYRDKEKAKDVVWQAAREIYAAKAAEAGDDSGNLDAARWKFAMQAATGGIDNHRGAHIALPWGYPYDRFRDELDQRVQVLAPAAVRATASELTNLPLQNVGDGRYIFKRGTGYVVDKDGRPLVVDFNVPFSAPGVPRAPTVPAAKLEPSTFSVTKGGAVTGLPGRGR